MQQSTPLNVLLVDDDEDDYILIRELLSDIPSRKIKTCWASGYNASLEKAISENFDAILLDYDLGAQDGLQWILEAQARGMNAPIIMVTGRGSYEKDVEAMRAGASDYISKSEMTGFLLERAIRYALERKQTEQELERRVRVRTAELQNMAEELSTSLEEMKVLEEELREQNQSLEEIRIQEGKDRIYYEELIEVAPVAFLLTDNYGNIRYANQRAEEMLNASLQIASGKPLSTFIFGPDVTRFRQELISLRGRERPAQFTIRIKPRNGQPVSILVSMALAPKHDQPIQLVQIYLHESAPLKQGDLPAHE